MPSSGLTYAPSHHSWSSTSSLPPWDSPEGTPDSTSSASSYFDPFNDHHSHRLSYQQPEHRRPSDAHSSSSASFRAFEALKHHDRAAEIDEWKWKCGQLEHHVQRLARQVELLRKERDDLMLESVATGTANLVFGLDGPDSDHNALPPTPCRWDGKSWTPIVSVHSSRPQIDPTKCMSKQNPPPCNAYYLLGECEVPRCRFCHTYELTESQVNEMRRGAKFHLCNAVQNGVECPDGAKCIYGHHCPRGPTCSRQHCAFNDEQHRVVPTPRPTLRRRSSFVSVQPPTLPHQQPSAHSHSSSSFSTLSCRRF